MAHDSWWSDYDSLAQEAHQYFTRGRCAGPAGIPGFEIRERISRGGQGSVYAGVQCGTHAPVAIKLLAHGYFSSRSAHRRFQREIELLRELKHRNIVSVLASGLTADGNPYLVMPRVLGLAYDEWAEQHRLHDLHRIIELHATLCDAVHFAHQHGVIHRDLKPSNVLVDEACQPNVLDFGLAKARAPAGGVAVTQLTQEAQFVGSLPWASPEQLAGDSDAVDTRTDVYALGVMLYQALTGRFPYTVDGALPAVVNNVMHVAPQRPGLYNPAVNAGLEAIALKALSKAPAQRYASAREFATDLRRFLSAGDSRARREQSIGALQRNVRRYQAIVAVSATLLALSGFLYLRASAARQRSETEAGKASAAARFLEDMFSSIDPSGSGLDVTVSEVLDRAAAEIPVCFANQPEVAAAMHQVLGNAYGRSGRKEAEMHYLRAWELRREVLGPDHPDTEMSALFVGRSTLFPCSERIELLRGIFDARRKRLGEAHPQTLTAQFSLATMLWSGGRLEEASGLVEDLIHRSRGSKQVDDRQFHTYVSQRVSFELIAGDLRRATEYLREFAQLIQHHPDPEYEHRLAIASLRASIELMHERYEEADPLLRFPIDVKRRVLGPNHPALDNTRVLLARVRIAQGRLREAEALLDAAVERVELPMFRFLPSAVVAFARAELLIARDCTEEAVALLQQAVRNCESSRDAIECRTRMAECELLAALVQDGRMAEGLPLAERLQTYYQQAPLSTVNRARLDLDTAECQLAAGRVTEGGALAMQTYTTLLDLFGDEHSLARRAARLSQALH